MTRLFSSVVNLLLVLVLGVSLSGCVTTHLPTASSSPWHGALAAPRPGAAVAGVRARIRFVGV